MDTSKNRRLVSGKRVLCRCALSFPKTDIFNQMPIRRNGLIVLNTRGGALYMNSQFNEQSIGKIFKPGQSGNLSSFILVAKDNTQHELGTISARFLRFTNGNSARGMVLRFVNLTEEQIDLLNMMVGSQPDVPENEGNIIKKMLEKFT